jgi:hypothetical protein
MLTFRQVLHRSRESQHHGNRHQEGTRRQEDGVKTLKPTVEHNGSYYTLSVRLLPMGRLKTGVSLL